MSEKTVPRVLEVVLKMTMADSHFLDINREEQADNYKI